MKDFKKREIKKGDVVLFEGNTGFFEKVIQVYNVLKFKESGPTHVGIVVKVVGEDVHIAEALSTGFQEVVYRKAQLSDMYEEDIIKVMESRKKVPFIDIFARKYYGRPYGFTDILAIATTFLFKWAGPISRFFKGDRFLICSEAVVRILYDASDGSINFEKEYGISFDMVSPMHIWLSEQMRCVWIDW